MLLYPNCKINIGLNVIGKRQDGFHNIESVFYPINWCDAIEIIENNDDNQEFTLNTSGNPLRVEMTENIVFKTWKQLTGLYKIPKIKVHLHKNIPSGAGLGGGSADAAFFIKALNQKFNLDISSDITFKIASSLGSDCAFFLRNEPLFAQGKGNEFSEIKLKLDEYYILIVYPNINIHTKEAYSNVSIFPINESINTIIGTHPVEIWKNVLKNDFEPSVFKKFPEIDELKQLLYKSGAHYASMSGSGSAVYGIFSEMPQINFPDSYKFFLQRPLQKF